MRPKTLEELREECAKVAEDLEQRWRNAATGVRPQVAQQVSAAADGLRAVALIIRHMSLEKRESGETPDA